MIPLSLPKIALVCTEVLLHKYVPSPIDPSPEGDTLDEVTKKGSCQMRTILPTRLDYPLWISPKLRPWKYTSFCVLWNQINGCFVDLPRQLRIWEHSLVLKGFLVDPFKKTLNTPYPVGTTLKVNHFFSSHCNTIETGGQVRTVSNTFNIQCYISLTFISLFKWLKFM